jgi:thiamine transport system permease protein
VLWPLLFAAGVLVASVAALLLAVILRSLVPMSSGAGIGTAWAALFNPSVTAVLGISTVGALGNTFFFAAVSAALALLFGLLVGYSLGGRLESTKRLQILLFLPLLISPVVLSFGLAEFWRPVFGGESMVWILIVISQTSLALPFALQSLNVALARIPHGYREVAQTLGSKPWPAYLDTEVPQVTNAFVTAGLFAFALSLGEFTATFFLATPRFTTLTVEIYRLQTIRLGAVSEALAGLLVLVSLATLFALALGGRRVEL